MFAYFIKMHCLFLLFLRSSSIFWYLGKSILGDCETLKSESRKPILTFPFVYVFYFIKNNLCRISLTLLQLILGIVAALKRNNVLFHSKVFNFNSLLEYVAYTGILEN